MKLTWAAWLNQHDGEFRLMLFVSSLIPMVILTVQFYMDALGFNPFDRLIAVTGFWAMIFMLLTLGITPIRRWLCFGCRKTYCHYGKRLSDWNFLIKSRRMLGLYCFFYASCHAVVYLHFELNWEFSWFYEDLKEKRYLILGVLTWLMTLLLALTSPKRMLKIMGRNWRKLHRLMYVLSVLAVIHGYSQAKVGDRLTFVVYGVLVFVLLLHRFLIRYVHNWYRKEDTGMLVERSEQVRAPKGK